MKNGIQQTIGVIKSLYRTTKQRLLLFVSEQFRKTEKTTKDVNLKYNFNMKDFFTESGRIMENRQRLREIYDQYKRLENYYPIFLAYLATIGLFIFDIISFAIIKNNNPIFISLTTITTISIIYVCYLIWIFFKGNSWTHDYLPKDVCDEYDSDVLEKYPNFKKGDDDFNNEILKLYRTDLDDFVLKNYKTYEGKTMKLKNIWIPMIFSILLLSINFITYKTITMGKLNEKPDARVTVENIDKTKSLFTDIETDRIREIVREEIRKSNTPEGKAVSLFENLDSMNVKNKRKPTR